MIQGPPETRDPETRDGGFRGRRRPEIWGVLDHVVLILGIKVDLVHGHRPGMRRVHELARHRARRRLQTKKKIHLSDPSPPKTQRI
jgi:hypothetical protein